MWCHAVSLISFMPRWLIYHLKKHLKNVLWCIFVHEKGYTGFDQSWVISVHKYTLHLPVNRIYSSRFCSLLHKMVFYREIENLVVWYWSWWKTLEKMITCLNPDLWIYSKSDTALSNLLILLEGLDWTVQPQVVPSNNPVILNKLIPAIPGKTYFIQLT